MMYQIRDKKRQKIIARFITKKDAEAFLSIKKKEDKDRYILVKAGDKEKKYIEG